MISVTEALEKLFLIAKVTPVETVELKKCLGRVLAKPLDQVAATLLSRHQRWMDMLYIKQT